jgi:hypothetical protein
MTMKKTLLFSIAAAGAFSFIASAQDHYAVASPKAKEQLDSLKTVPGITTIDIVDRSVGEGTPKSRGVVDSMRKVPTDYLAVDLAHAPQPPFAPKDPRYEIALRENAVREVEVEVASSK